MLSTYYEDIYESTKREYLMNDNYIDIQPSRIQSDLLELCVRQPGIQAEPIRAAAPRLS